MPIFSANSWKRSVRNFANLKTCAAEYLRRSGVRAQNLGDHRQLASDLELAHKKKRLPLTHSQLLALSFYETAVASARSFKRSHRRMIAGSSWWEPALVRSGFAALVNTDRRRERVMPS